jgi:hypothetical protein
VSHEYSDAESKNRSNGSAPSGQVNRRAEAVELRFPSVEYEGINQLMKEVEPIGNAPEIDDWLWQIASSWEGNWGRTGSLPDALVVDGLEGAG